jgi:hypothetical protein
MQNYTQNGLQWGNLFHKTCKEREESKNIFRRIGGISLPRERLGQESFVMSLFTDHPASVGETYVQHMGSASFFGSRMILAGLACMLHGLLPFLFTTTGRQTIEMLHDRMVVNRHRQPTSAPSAADRSRRVAA